MKILYVAAENAPYGLVGGLSQAVSFLARAVGKLGHDTRVFMPKYGVIDEKKYPMNMVTENMSVPTEAKGRSKFPKELICNVKFRDSDEFYVPTYFLENREYYELRANVYAYSDEHVRFYLLSIGCLEWLLQQKEAKGWVPDIIHAHDWHAGYLVDLIKNHPRYNKALKKIKVLFTVHNFKHQANHRFQFDPKPDNGKASLLPISDPKMKTQNALLRGVINADHVNTVSPTHAKEVQKKEFGEGLEKHLQKYAFKLTGIANGIDTDEMDPLKDPNIVSNFDVKTLEKRKANKKDLQKLFGLPVDPKIPLIAFVGRLRLQKGVELIFHALEKIEILPKSQFIFLGGGDDNYATQLGKYCEKYPTRISAVLQEDFKLPRKIFAGSDILLVPSKFEPGGIVAMEALRYGCVPIVADTGGLSETIEEFSPQNHTGNGFLHERGDNWSFFVKLIQALTFFSVPDLWKSVVQNAIKSDFSWDNTALEYQKLYKQLKDSK